MAATRGGVGLPEKRMVITEGEEEEGVMVRYKNMIMESPIVMKGRQAAEEVKGMGTKLAFNAGRKLFYAVTTAIVLVVPLVIAMDREQQMNELEQQQASLLGTPTVHGGK